ncbi:hypothetical protein D3C76_1404670 [compost metagenome]
MPDAGDHQIHQVLDGDQASSIVDGAKRQWYATVEPAHHVEEVGLHSGPVYQYRAHDHHLKAGVPGQRLQSCLRLQL